ncbi:MAG: IS91 family transposase [Candidatus Latescibacterota bacterium]
MHSCSSAHVLCPQGPPAPTGGRPRWELADVFRLYGERYRAEHPLSRDQLKVMSLIERCRTASLGGHLDRCDTCGYELPSYNSCRNRHCPKCQTLAKERWLQQRQEELLPVGYFHLVFTLPHELNPLVLCNKRALLALLFNAVADTLQAFAHDPQWRLEGQLGFLAVLHTWSQTLIDHFHLHCLIPAGVLREDGSWQSARQSFLFRTQSLAKAFCSRYLHLLQRCYREHTLLFLGSTSPLGAPEQFAGLLDSLRDKPWIVFAKRPFAGPQQVLDYLGRYTHRVAISNHRILSIHEGRLTFSYRDRRDHNLKKHMSLDAQEFIRRFLLHVLPPGFMKIRHFGFLANPCKMENLTRIREQLGEAPSPAAPQSPAESVAEIMLRITGQDITRCPRCRQGRLVPVDWLLPPSAIPDTEAFDTS